MAKLFRRTRQKFLRENRFSKYLIYAIGEIALVVIGILVALQINAVHQNRQRAKLEKVLLQQVKFELLETYGDIWTDEANLELGKKSHDAISKYIDEDIPYSDSLCFDFFWINKDEYIYPTNAAYGRIKKEGLDIIQQDSLRIYLQALYEGQFPRLTKHNAPTPDIAAVFNEYYLNNFKPNTDLTLEFDFQLPNDTVGSRIYSDIHYHYPKMDQQIGRLYTIGYTPLDFDALKNDPKFHLLLKQTYRFRNTKLIHYSSAKFIIQDVIRLIDQELEQ